jgi:FAD/FMN-containing dehydrogenase
LRSVLQRARLQGLRVSIAGARHTMGGHTIAPQGVVIDMRPFRQLSLDEDSDILTAGAGAVWHDVLAYLDPRGRSVQIMQSNDSFTVGGSISVNCHGWQYGRPPIASTVESFRLMKADGTIVTCSRTEHPELFSLTLGGYGLFGIILDARLKVTRNVRYRVTRYVVPAAEAMLTYQDKVASAGRAAMVYARMDVSADNFLREVMLYVLEEDPPADGVLAPVSPPGFVSLRRSIFRGSMESDYGKRLRWDAETRLQPALSPSHYTRNQVLDEGVEVFQNRSAETTDILHEYFLPPEQLEAFILMLQERIPQHRANLLNVTIRSVNEDPDTFLRYADRAMLSVVMLFSQPRTDEGDARMQTLTQSLIDDALRLHGRYYLPYRLHATREQFQRAYPQARAFFAKKREYDPDELFVNQFYLRYGTADVGAEEN